MKNLCIIIRHQFSVTSTSQQVTQLSNKLRLNQTVGDKKKLQQFLETQVQDGKLIQTLNRTAKYDDGFKDFLEDYKRKHNIKNILDLSHYANSPLSKSQNLREEELKVIQDFAQKKKQGLFEKQQFDFDQGVKDQDEIELKEKYEGFETRTGLNIFDSFQMIIVDRDTNTQVTTLNRINSFRQLVFMGNSNGVISYGKGKGYDFESAMSNAIKDAKRNLIPIPLDLWQTCPTELYSKQYTFRLWINPRPKGMNAYGHPMIATFLMLAGITHCKFKCLARNYNPYAMCYAFMDAVTQNVTPEEISETLGVKVYRQYWGRKIGRQIPINIDGI